MGLMESVPVVQCHSIATGAQSVPFTAGSGVSRGQQSARFFASVFSSGRGPGLENRQSFTGLVSSNLTLSARLDTTPPGRKRLARGSRTVVLQPLLPDGARDAQEVFAEDFAHVPAGPAALEQQCRELRVHTWRSILHGPG